SLWLLEVGSTIPAVWASLPAWFILFCPSMSFLNEIFSRLDSSADQTLLAELRDSGEVKVSGRELLGMVAQARAFLSSRALQKGDRCAVIAANGIRWIAIDLAIMAEGLIAVPLYSRQATSELVAMMKDCSPVLICCGDAAVRDDVIQEWPDAPPQALFDEIFATPGDGASSS